MKRDLLLAAITVAIVACSAQDMVRVGKIAVTGDVQSARQMATQKVVRYAFNPTALKNDINRFNRNFTALVKAFTGSVIDEWGEKEARVPTPKTYVKYTQNYRSRAMVDFDAGRITVETVDQKSPEKSLKSAIVTTLLTPRDPRSVDLYSAKPVPLGPTPFLYREVVDHDGKFIRWSWRAERYADYLMAHRLTTRDAAVKGKSQRVHSVTFDMVRDHLNVRASKYRPHVERFAGKYRVSKNLVYAIMKTESDFNPYAVSSAPAFGLMQIVPESAGSDVNRLLNKSRLPTREELFDPETNILYGTAYLHILDRQYLEQVAHPVSREYCTIAAYNAGAGNVLRTFDADRARAVRRINEESPSEVYDTLRTRLPRAEARRYLAKVVSAKKAFVNF